MTKLITMALVAQAALAGAASAHEAKTHPTSLNWGKGVCHVQANAETMAMIEAKFKSVPQSTRMNLQHMMRHAGLYTGMTDGIWGKKTDCAFKAVATRYPGAMTGKHLEQFFEYMLSGSFIKEYPGSPSASPHPGVLY
jgi:hypothetical protein